MITRAFSFINKSKGFARNTLIEEAINKYIAEAEKFLLDEHNINIEDKINEARAKKYDTVILSSRGGGFEQTVLGEAEPMCWYPCKISADRGKKLKYIAGLQLRPLPIMRS